MNGNVDVAVINGSSGWGFGVLGFWGFGGFWLGFAIWSWDGVDVTFTFHGYFVCQSSPCIMLCCRIPMIVVVGVRVQ